jgi:formyltetrahydrofolate deformylase
MSEAMHATLLVSCRDRTGLVAALSTFIGENGGNIVDADQHSEPPAPAPGSASAAGTGEGDASDDPSFFMRVVFDLTGFVLDRAELQAALAHLAKRFEMDYRLHLPPPPEDGPPEDVSTQGASRVAVFCSKTPHCLYDLLVRQAMGELAGRIALVVSNHEHLRSAAEHFDVPFEHVPVTRQTKPDAEARQLQLLDEHGIETVVLARYMQILSADFLTAGWAGRTINIHHSFLPAFAGAKPYHQAKARGVKIIGATAHYVTAELDQGPIIEQDVVRVTHRDSVADLVRKGRDIERQVLARAVRRHLEHRVLIHGNRTIVFR